MLAGGDSTLTDFSAICEGFRGRAVVDSIANSWVPYLFSVPKFVAINSVCTDPLGLILCVELWDQNLVGVLASGVILPSSGLPFPISLVDSHINCSRTLLFSYVS